MVSKMHCYTNKQADFIKENIKGCNINDLTEIFNKHFNLNLKDSQVRAFIKNHSLKSGLDCRFKPGYNPFSKGKKGSGGYEPTQFKKGDRPHNYLPVGAERVNGEDYVDVKIVDPNKWKAKHILIWEKENGQPTPKGHVVIFGDRNRRNFDPANLILVSRHQLMVLNRKNLIQNNAELTHTAVMIADLHIKISKRTSNKSKIK